MTSLEAQNSPINTTLIGLTINTRQLRHKKKQELVQLIHRKFPPKNSNSLAPNS
jgi:hypothetical protein